jgi:hypothetical protein
LVCVVFVYGNGSFWGFFILVFLVQDSSLKASLLQAEINHLMDMRAPLIAKRNSIIDCPLVYFNPFSRKRKRLKEIDARLDQIDIQIHAVYEKGLTD